MPGDVRHDVAGDLEELFHRRRAADGRSRAAVWYWRHSVSTSLRFLAERVRDRTDAHMPSTLSWIDCKLALRMLVRSPGLTLVGVVGMSVGIAIAVAAFTIAGALLDPVLPLEDGDRVVSIQNWDVSTNNRNQRVLHDFLAWREQLDLVHDLGAFRTVARNLIAPGAQPETVSVAEISASAFRVARVTALLGRYLLPEDERAGAPDVVVLGEDVWRRRFGAAPDILGHRIQLGATTYAVAGVMPSGFAFPLNHSYWIPLRLPAASQPGAGPAMSVFARLAPGVAIDAAQAKLTAIGIRTSEAHPATHEHLRPRIMPYTYAFTDMDDPQNALALHAAQSFIVMLLVLVCVNVAILVYARTATRQGEIAVRTALGASRRRIVTQLFVEALVLAGLAAVVGIGLVAFGLAQLQVALTQLAAGLPFWMHFRLSGEAMLYVVALTVLAAAIVGVVPALKATGRRVQTRLQSLSAGGGSRMQMGTMWTTLIVMQVAIAVALLPATMYHAWNTLNFRAGDRGYAAHEFLTTEVVMDRGSELLTTADSDREFRSRYGIRQAELERRLEAEAGVGGVTFSLTNPGAELAAVVEVDGQPPPVDPVDYNIVAGSTQGHLVRFNRIGLDFFEIFEVPVLAGRALAPGDADSASHGPDHARSNQGILVNRAFVDRILGRDNPLGRRIKYVGRSREAGDDNVELDRWYEIVGVVKDFPPYAMHNDGSDARIYHAAAPGAVHPATISVRVRGASPSSFADRVRAVTATVDPSLQLRNLATVEDVVLRERGMMRLIGVTLASVTLAVIVLSAAGIYALMSFTVARRRKEIGIRAALGADPVRILAGVFSRAFGQLATGAALGMLGAIGLESLLEGEMFQGHGAIVLPMVAVFTTLVGVAAALGPARRGLRIQPTEALREE